LAVNETGVSVQVPDRPGGARPCAGRQAQDDRAALGPSGTRTGSTTHSGPHVQWLEWSPAMSAQVTLNIYNYGTSRSGQEYVRHGLAVSKSTFHNGVEVYGSGPFHCGIEVYNAEWSYGGVAEVKAVTGSVGTTGVIGCRPRKCANQTYRESVFMGKTSISEQEVLRLIQQLRKLWPVSAYNPKMRNCAHFCDELSQKLGAGSLPSWVLSLAAGGKTSTSDPAKGTCWQHCASDVSEQCCAPMAGPMGVVAAPPDAVRVAEDAPRYSELYSRYSNRPTDATAAKRNAMLGLPLVG